MRDHADNVRRHLLDRELRPDGRAHRRLDHRRAGADAHRRRVPARCATPRSRASAASASRPAARTCSSRVDPTNGDMVVIEMNPRVSRSSALASKATGFPIAKIAARARGRLHARRDPERHHRARRRPASSRPSTTSSPRCRAGRSRSFPARRGVLGTLMQSVGEVMAIGRTFPESLQKALRSLETGRLGLNCDPAERELRRARRRRARAPRPRSPRPTGRSSSRPRCAGASSVERLHEATGSTRGSSTRSLADRRGARRASPRRGFDGMTRRDWRRAKRLGFADAPARVPVGRRPRPTCARARLAAGVARHVQDRRHLRGRVRGEHAVPLRHLRGRGRGRAAPSGRGRDPRQRARTASARASSSTTAACTPRSRCATPASRR